ncbi:jg26554 [Pararge aegeria aegeria]|uniref:Jg26554 protein n=1 Tax=Pararge aegeria aegeria TaxID=348720 RepID=A0A8S4R1I8_9NEOP|nr:jg26554 [Pararge aegeria aegeria]
MLMTPAKRQVSRSRGDHVLLNRRLRAARNVNKVPQRSANKRNRGHSTVNLPRLTTLKLSMPFEIRKNFESFQTLHCRLRCSDHCHYSSEYEVTNWHR